MAIVDTLTKYEFVERFLEIRPDNFSREGLEALYDDLEDLSEGMGEAIEFDPIAICCDYTEYDSIEEAIEDYPSVENFAHLDDLTDVLKLENGKLVVRNF
jgi:hypothetical protein